nr:uncharacterized protein LOC118680230 isoform X2 [Bactrocera oleae]
MTVTQLNISMVSLESLTEIFVRSTSKKKVSYVHLCYQNVRGLRTKLSTFQTALAANQYDVVCISESWLHSSICDGEVIDSTYIIYRKDRVSLINEQVRGGGVFIACKRSLHTEKIAITNNDLEQIFIRVKGASRDMIIGCIYIPPQSTLEIFECHIATVSFIIDKYQNSNVMIVDDFNIPSSLPRVECEKKLYDGFASLNCTQQNYIQNAWNSTLDLCFSDIDSSPEHAVALVPEDKYHPAIDILLNFRQGLTPDNSSSYVFKKANYAALNTSLLRTNWIDLYKLETIDIHVHKPSNYPSWFSHDLIHKVKQKKSAHLIYKIWKTKPNYLRFSRLRLKCKKLSIDCYKSYVDKVEDKLQSEIKAFWNFIKDKNRCTGDIPSSVAWNDRSADTGPGISNLFASFFHNIYAPSNSNDPGIATFNPGTQRTHLYALTVTYDAALKELLALDPSKGPGPDGLPNIFIKNCAVGLCEPLTHIFGESLHHGTFPTYWKLSYISPIHKEGPKTLVTNYRPICIQSALAKLFERLVLPQIRQAFENIIPICSYTSTNC